MVSCVGAREGEEAILKASRRRAVIEIDQPGCVVGPDRAQVNPQAIAERRIGFVLTGIPRHVEIPFGGLASGAAMRGRDAGDRRRCGPRGCSAALPVGRRIERRASILTSLSAMKPSAHRIALDSVTGDLLLFRRSKERKLGGEIEPSLLHFDVVGDRLLREVRQRRRR